MVCEYLMSYTKESSDIYKLLEKLKRDLQSQPHEDIRSSIDAQMKKRNDEMDHLVFTLSQKNYSPAFTQRVNQRIEESLTRRFPGACKKREQLDKESELVADQELQIDLLAGALASLKDNFHLLSVHERNAL